MKSIGDVARDAGLRPSAIRYYERLGLLPAPERRGGRRCYTDDVLPRLEVIRFARDSGFTLGEIAKLLAGRQYSARLRELATEKIAELETMVERARTMQGLLRSALRCNCLTPEECGRLMRRARAATRASVQGRSTRSWRV
jgi:MerR family transcriptional regulator, redox-sensitive transcriptional activator SoxR